MTQSENNVQCITLVVLCFGTVIFVTYVINSKVTSTIKEGEWSFRDVINRVSGSRKSDDKVEDVLAAYKLYKELESAESRQLSRDVRILCQVMTYHKHHANRAIAVRDTWGRHCNILVFISDEADSSIPTVDVNVKKQSRGVWKMTVESLKYINKKYAGQFDWVYKCDDDTFAIVENMRSLLKNYDPNELSFFGHHLKSLGTYMSGGSGYIISNATLQHFLNNGISAKHKNCTSQDYDYEDVQMGHCMTSLGVRYVDSRDANGRHRFFTEGVTFHADGTKKEGNVYNWYNQTSQYPVYFGLTCCSEDPIAFHHLFYKDMYMLEYMTYGMKHPKPLFLQP